jgi:putative endonuclease
MARWKRFNHAPSTAMHAACVYILADRRHGTLYVGVTSHLPRRIAAHREGIMAGFTRYHDVQCLVWFEEHRDMPAAIARERQVKAIDRHAQRRLVDLLNPEWRDLAPMPA